MRIIDDLKLDYSDVLLVPKRSSLESRNDVSLSRNYRFKHSSYRFDGIPLIAANMQGVGTLEIARAFQKDNMLVSLTREERDNCYQTKAILPNNIIPTFGITPEEKEKLNQLIIDRNPKYVCVDAANGYMERFVDFIEMIRNDFKYTGVVMCGNVVTAEMTEELILAGADVIKIGLGSGGNCTTRIVAGVGYPQLSAVIECSDAAHGLGGHIIADGGITCPGDIVKAFAANADFVMLGTYLAGHDEGKQPVIVENNKQYVEFFGNSSKSAQKQNGEIKEYRASEGRTTRIPYKGPIVNTIQEIQGGIRSALTYTGSKSLKELSKRATFIRVNNQYNKAFEHFTVGN